MKAPKIIIDSWGDWLAVLIGLAIGELLAEITIKFIQ